MNIIIYNVSAKTVVYKQSVYCSIVMLRNYHTNRMTSPRTPDTEQWNSSS